MQGRHYSPKYSRRLFLCSHCQRVSTTFNSTQRLDIVLGRLLTVFTVAALVCAMRVDTPTLTPPHLPLHHCLQPDTS